MNEEFQIDVYETARGKLPYSEWENDLSASKTFWEDYLKSQNKG